MLKAILLIAMSMQMIAVTIASYMAGSAQFDEYKYHFIVFLQDQFQKMICWRVTAPVARNVSLALPKIALECHGEVALFPVHHLAGS